MSFAPVEIPSTIPTAPIEQEPDVELTPLQLEQRERERVLTEQAQEQAQGGHFLEEIQGARTDATPVDPLLADIEKILEMDLGTLVAKDASEPLFSPEAEASFVAEGKRVAQAIATMGHRLKYTEVLSLVQNWLKLIPKVNKWFLYQDAKIKTDVILQRLNPNPS